MMMMTNMGVSSIELTIYSVTFFLLLSSYFLIVPSRRRRLPPGPRPFPIVGNLPHLGKVPHHTLTALAKDYGPLMYLRLGYVDVVVASSAAVVSQFLKTHDSNFCSRPATSGSKHIGYNHNNMVFAPNGPRWRMLRKICHLHLFSAKALDTFRHVRQEEVGVVLVGALAKAERKAVQVGQVLNLCTSNVLGRVMLGKRVFGDGTGKVDLKSNEFKDMVVELLVLSGAFNIGDFVPLLDWLDLQGIVRKMKKLHKRFDAFFTHILDDHKAAATLLHGNETSDLLSFLISLKDNCDGTGDKLSDTEIKALLLDLFLGGTDTPSSTTEWAIAELIRHPKVMGKVQDELDLVVGRERLVKEDDLPKLTYFQAVMKEVFRLHPATPLSIPRLAAESCDINNYHIPKNATVLVNIWAIARDPDVWSNPLEFRPDRFLPGGERPNADVRGKDFELIPFGAGRRMCVAVNHGLRMVHFMTATLVHAFDLELADGQTPQKLDMEEAFGLTLQRKLPLMLYPNHRLPSHAYTL